MPRSGITICGLLGFFTLLAAGCGRDAPPELAEERVQRLREGLSSEQIARVLQAVQRQADSVDRKLRRVPGLTRQERRALLRDVNAVQTSRARQVGIPRGSSIDELVKAGRLVELEDTTQLWIVRKLDYSVPYVTPATRALLVEIGTRFQARLDSMSLPRFRIEITSALRTAEHQSALRRRNANASREISAHEYGTTVDIAYRHYAPPVQDTVAGVPLSGEFRAWTDSIMVETAHDRAGALQAILGRVLRDLRAEGRVLVRMERRQTVYHITVTRAGVPRGA